MSVRKYIPDMITSMNLLSGVLGVIAVFQGFYCQAFILMIFAAVFDFFDGLAARALNAYSEMGKELDSLADVVSFGVLPSLMCTMYMLNTNGGIFAPGGWWIKAICFIPLVIAIFSALRLAKFNVDERQTSSFLGMPTPCCAMILGSLICLVNKSADSFLTSWCDSLIFLPLVSVCFAALLICDMPMFSMKFHKGENLLSAAYIKRYILAAVFVLSVIVALVTSMHWSSVIFMTMVFYVLENVVCAVLRF